MKILLFTSQDISIKLTKFFFNKKDVELTVVTQLTKRDKIYGYTYPFEYCKNNNITCWTPSKIDKVFINKVRSLVPDLIISAYYPKIFPKELIDIPPLGAINIHPGDLPFYRGPFTIPWTILNGEKELTVTLHYIDSYLDSGDIIAKSKKPISSVVTGFELYLQAMNQSARLLMDSFDKFISGKTKRIPQVGYGSYYKKLKPICHIDWQLSRIKIDRLVRVHAKPYLPAFSYLINHCVYFNRVILIEQKEHSANNIGIIIDVLPDKSFIISCSDGLLLVKNYDVYPKMSIKEFRLHFVKGAKFT